MRVKIKGSLKLIKNVILEHQGKKEVKEIYKKGTNKNWQLLWKGIRKGTIVIYDGDISEIPSGWQLCDGTNGTPDLRGKFIMGSDEAGVTGGSNEHNHLIETASVPHTHTISSRSHSHSSGYSDGMYVYKWRGEDNLEDYDASGASHSHNCSINSMTHNHEGVSGSVVTYPNHYKLAYIMKL